MCPPMELNKVKLYLNYDFDSILELVGTDYLPQIIKGTNEIAQQHNLKS